MHCNGCAKKVQKHISKMEGNTVLRDPSFPFRTLTTHPAFSFEDRSRLCSDFRVQSAVCVVEKV
jgi:copper chaperone CopZ